MRSTPRTMVSRLRAARLAALVLGLAAHSAWAQQQCMAPGGVLAVNGKCPDQSYTYCGDEDPPCCYSGCGDPQVNAYCGFECCPNYGGACACADPSSCTTGLEPCCVVQLSCFSPFPITCGHAQPVCGNGKCERGENAASCPTDCCTEKPEHNVVRGLDTVTGNQAHLARGSWDLLSFECDTRGGPGTTFTDSWTEPPCKVRVDGGYLGQIPSTDGSPTQYCWSDGYEGVVYTQTQNGYKTSPADDTALVFVDGKPQIQNHTEGWAVTFADQDSGKANTYTDKLGNSGWLRGQTKLVREDGEWNAVWRDNVTWHQDATIPGWSPLQFARHETSAGIQTEGFSPGNVSGTQFSIHRVGATSSMLTVSQVPSQYDGQANGIEISVSYDGSSVVENAFFDVASSDGYAYTWNQNTRLGERITETDGTSLYSGQWNTLVLAANAVPPSDGNAWSGPAVAVVGKYPLTANGLSWSRNGVVELQFSTDAMGNTNSVTSEDGRSWTGTFDELQRVKNETISEGGTQTLSHDVKWNATNGLVDSDTATSLGNTVAWTPTYTGARETPDRVQITLNGLVVSSAVPTFTTSDVGFPVIQKEVDTVGVDAFGGTQPETASFVYGYPGAGQLQVDEATLGIHVTATDYPDGRLQKVSASTPWVSSTSGTLSYGGGGYLASFDGDAQLKGGPQLSESSTAGAGVLVGKSSQALSIGGVSVVSISDTATWDGHAGFDDQATRTDLLLTSNEGNTSSDPLAWSATDSATSSDKMSVASSLSCSMNAGYHVMCMANETEDGDKLAGSEAENL